MSCPCHSGSRYANCCEPFHKGTLPNTPKELMRSRYSAYALNLSQYIIETTHPDQPAPNKTEIEFFSNQTKFTGLEIIDSTETTVTFRALLSTGSFQEKSLFKKVKGKWTYHSALTLERL